MVEGSIAGLNAKKTLWVCFSFSLKRLNVHGTPVPDGDVHFHHLLSIFCSDQFLFKKKKRKKDKHFNIIGSDYTVCCLVLHHILL